MPNFSSLSYRLSALTGFLAVALGAFGAHALKATLAARPGATEMWEKAVFYHLVHAVVMLVVAGTRPFAAGAWRLFALGILLFSGSLYLYDLTQWFPLVFATPLGGLCLLGGWLWLAFRPAREAQP